MLLVSLSACGSALTIIFDGGFADTSGVDADKDVDETADMFKDLLKKKKKKSSKKDEEKEEEVPADDGEFDPSALKKKKYVHIYISCTL
jgi:hypothetical protein